MKKQESDAPAIGSRHPEVPSLFLVGWVVVDGDRVRERATTISSRAHGLAMFNTRAKARVKATSVGLGHDAAKPCWAEVFVMPIPEVKP